MTREDMERLTAGMDNKSEKIRVLFDAGGQRADIARFLDISYQHVQNVLKRSNRLGKPAEVDRKEPERDQVYTVKIGAGGRIALPPEYIGKHDIAEGEVLICREEHGGLTIMSRAAAIEALREIARQRMPGEAGLLEALLGAPPRTS